MSTGAHIGKQLKMKGMQLSASKHKDSLQAAQLVAEFLAGDGSVITIENVYKHVKPVALGNSAGAVFRGPQWEFVAFLPTLRPETHARYVRGWRLRANK